MKKILTLFFTLNIFLYYGCSDRPSVVLDEDEMVSLLADMQIAESYANISGGVSNKEARIEMGKRVMQMHGVTQEQIDTTLAYYGRNLDDYSALFEKVDKEINKRRAEISDKTPTSNSENQVDLWPYTIHGMITDKAGSDGWIFSIESPSVSKGERIIWSMFLPDFVKLKGNIGVQYSDGSQEFNASTFNNNHNLELSLQTDTGKRVTRLFGSLTVANRKDLPVYADSIRLYILPFDSIEYTRVKRGQRRFGSLEYLKPKPVIKPKESADSLSLSDRVTSKSHS